jgi:succinate-semialdehyde dehydrogenase / glutarate-semialdehyde dehydrogenase
MPQYPDLQLFVAGDWKSADGAPVINPADEISIGTVGRTILVRGVGSLA